MTVQAERAAPEPFRLRTILVPTDFSDCSGRALALARGLTQQVEPAHLILIHACFLPPESKTLADRDYESLLAEISQGATEELGRVSADLREKGVSVELAVEQGSPETVVVDAAAERGADLIVMGTHGRTGLPQVLLGSVAERVVRTAPCPVVTVKLD
jgi:nucleotide-binding universal stress UspA family protein